MEVEREIQRLHRTLEILFFIIIGLGIVVLIYGLTVAGDESSADESTAQYTSDLLKVRITYPEAWTYDENENVFSDGYGFFSLHVLEGSPTDVHGVCEEHATSNTDVYGSNPMVQFAHISGQRGCYIFGSADGDRSGIVVKTKRAVTVGDQKYRYVLVSTSQEHALSIGESLRVLR